MSNFKSNDSLIHLREITLEPEPEPKCEEIKLIKKRKRFALLQLMFKCYRSISIIVFSYMCLMYIPFVKNGINYVVNKLEWNNYGVWVWFVVGAFAGLIWHLITEYKIACHGKENCNTTSIKYQ